MSERPVHHSGDNTRRELAELRDSMTDVGGIRATPAAIAIMQETGTDPGELAARYLEDCVRARNIDMVGYFLDEEKEPHGSGAVHVVLDPETNRTTIYEEFY